MYVRPKRYKYVVKFVEYFEAYTNSKINIIDAIEAEKGLNEISSQCMQFGGAILKRHVIQTIIPSTKLKEINIKNYDIYPFINEDDENDFYGFIESLIRSVKDKNVPMIKIIEKINDGKDGIDKRIVTYYFV